ncbi:RmuC family-domain-containing protein [Pelagophyceae sp. CCMP2097]|nr:RmuC family-domain-containing protein [Pelagophyceae sp. CCMP2097]
MAASEKWSGDLLSFVGGVAVGVGAVLGVKHLLKRRGQEFAQRLDGLSSQDHLFEALRRDVQACQTGLSTQFATRLEQTERQLAQRLEAAERGLNSSGETQRQSFESQRRSFDAHFTTVSSNLSTLKAALATLEVAEQGTDGRVADVDAKLNALNGLLVARKQLESNLKRHVVDVTKKYIVLGKTVNHAIIFLPSESLFSDVHQHHGDVVDAAMRKRVWICSPTALMALLHTVDLNLRDMRENFRHVLDDVKSLVEDVAKLAETSALVQTHFNRANNQLKLFQKAVKRVEDRGRSLGKPPQARLHDETAANTTFDDAAENGAAADGGVAETPAAEDGTDNKPSNTPPQ